jgi:hypothetical protein
MVLQGEHLWFGPRGRFPGYGADSRVHWTLWRNAFCFGRRIGGCSQSAGPQQTLLPWAGEGIPTVSPTIASFAVTKGYGQMFILKLVTAE